MAEQEQRDKADEQRHIRAETDAKRCGAHVTARNLTGGSRASTSGAHSWPGGRAAEVIAVWRHRIRLIGRAWRRCIPAQVRRRGSVTLHASLPPWARESARSTPLSAGIMLARLARISKSRSHHVPTARPPALPVHRSGWTVLIRGATPSGSPSGSRRGRNPPRNEQDGDKAIIPRASPWTPTSAVPPSVARPPGARRPAPSGRQCRGACWRRRNRDCGRAGDGCVAADSQAG